MTLKRYYLITTHLITTHHSSTWQPHKLHPGVGGWGGQSAIRWFLPFFVLLLSLWQGAARAEDPDPWMADAQSIAAEFQQHPSPRQVVVVFDISGSMRSRVPETGLSRWQEARAATSQLMTSTLHPGDALTILPFDSVVHTPQSYPSLTSEQIPTVGQLIPKAISGETGTNMRLAHYQALQILRQQYDAAPQGKHPWQAIVVVSDGFNDAPPLHSGPWTDYAKFCNVHSDNQNLYPETQECNTWRKLSQRFESSGEGKTFGIGVKVDEGVPEYRPPGEKPLLSSPASGAEESGIAGTIYEGDHPAQGAHIEADDARGNQVNVTTTGPDGHFILSGLGSGAYTLVANKGRESARIEAVQAGNKEVEMHITQSLIWLWVVLALLVILAAAATTLIARSRRASKVRIQIKDSTGRNRTFWLGGGTKVSLGGKEVSGQPIFPLEVFAAPVAHLRHSATGYSLITEKGIDAEAGGRKINGSGEVHENSIILLKDSAGAQATVEFRDISSRTKTAAASIAGAGQEGDPYSKLDANLRG